MPSLFFGKFRFPIYTTDNLQIIHPWGLLSDEHSCELMLLVVSLELYSHPSLLP